MLRVSDKVGHRVDLQRGERRRARRWRDRVAKRVAHAASEPRRAQGRIPERIQ